MSRSRDQCLNLISKLHNEINQGNLNWEDYEKLIPELENVTQRLYVHRNRKLISESKEMLAKYDIQ